jgi:hypothetical protein
MLKFNCWSAFASILIGLCSILAIPTEVCADAEADQYQQRLAQGEVLLSNQDIGSMKYISGRILIAEQPEAVWPVLVNPFQFKGDICDRMQGLDVLVDQPDHSRLRMSMYCGWFPRITYIVESKYSYRERIEFRRISGAMKNFTGYWALSPSADRKGTIVTFALFVEPDIPIPQWLVRQGIRIELPRTLQNLRKRVVTSCKSGQAPEGRTLLAARMTVPLLKK